MPDSLPAVMRFLPAFSVAFAVTLALGFALRVLIGTRLNLYLVNSDSLILDQALIPITNESRRRSVIGTLRSGSWREDIRIRLSDYRGGSAEFRVQYNLFKRYRIELVSEPEVPVQLKGKAMIVGRARRLRTGSKLEVGDRTYTAVVTMSASQAGLLSDAA